MKQRGHLWILCKQSENCNSLCVVDLRGWTALCMGTSFFILQRKGLWHLQDVVKYSTPVKRKRRSILGLGPWTKSNVIDEQGASAQRQDVLFALQIRKASGKMHCDWWHRQAVTTDSLRDSYFALSRIGMWQFWRMESRSIVDCLLLLLLIALI